MIDQEIIANVRTGTETDARFRTVPAGLIVDLLYKGKSSGPGLPGPDDRRVIRLRGAVIEQRLDLRSLDCACPLELLDCTLRGGIDVSAANLKWLSLRGCTVADLNGMNLNVDRSLRLDHGFRSSGAVLLTSATIGRAFIASDAWFDHRADTSLDLTDATIGAQLNLSGSACGRVSLLGTKLGPLLADGLHLTADGAGAGPRGDLVGVALDARNCNVSGDFRLGQDSVTTGRIWLSNATVTGWLRCSNSHVQVDGGPAILAEELSVHGSLSLDERFEMQGELVLTGAHIGGDLDLSGAALSSSTGYAVRAAGMQVDGDLRGTSVGPHPFRCDGEFHLMTAQLKGNVDLRHAAFALPPGIVAGSRPGDRPDEEPTPLNLSGASIGGLVDARKARFLYRQGTAFNANGAAIAQTMDMRDAIFDGTVDLTGARTGGQLNLGGAQITHRSLAIIGDGLSVGTDMYMDASGERAFSAHGTVRLVEATIGADLSCRGGQFTAGEDGRAIEGSGITVGAVSWMDSKRDEQKVFRSNGAVVLKRSKLVGNLQCRGSEMRPAGDLPAFDGQASSFLQSVDFTDADVYGVVDMTGCSTAQALNMSGAHIESAPGGEAIRASGIKVGTDLCLSASDNRRFDACGTVDISGSIIGGNLACSGGSCLRSGGGKPALDAALVTVGGEALLDPKLAYPFAATGGVSLRSARVSGRLTCRGAQLVAGDGGYAFDGRQLSVGARLEWKQMDPCPRGSIRLEAAAVGWLDDDESSWPSDPAGQDRLVTLEGFTYSGLSAEAFKDFDARLAWLRKAPYSIQPYQQLRSYYVSAGQPVEGRKAAIAKEDDKRRLSAEFGPIAGSWHWFKGFVVRYGYQPLRALWFLAGVVVLACVIFAWAHHLGVMQPSGGNSATVPAFNPISYSVDTVVPVVDLDQRSNWYAQWNRPDGPPFVIAQWVFTISGWVLATMAVAGFTGLLDPDPKTG